MVTHINKRDGSIVLFNRNRIAKAIDSAAKAVGIDNDSLVQKLTDSVVEIINKEYSNRVPSVEEVQDIVENILVDNRQKEIAKAYIVYRERHRSIRELGEVLNPTGLVEDYVEQTDWRVNENSNMAYSLQGLNNYISTAIISRYWLANVFKEKIKKSK